MAKDFGTRGQEETRYAPKKPTIKPRMRVFGGKTGKPMGFDGKAGPGQRIIPYDCEGRFAVVNVKGERIISHRKTMEGSRSQVAKASATAKVERFIHTNEDVDRVLDRPEPAPIVNPGPAPYRKGVDCRRRLVRPR